MGKSPLKCPKCRSTDLGLCLGGQTGQYECMECGYIGPVAIRDSNKRKSDNKG